MDWNKQLTDQLEFHWTVQARPRLEGLTDEEYLWQPVPGAWTIQEDNSIDWQYPAPEPTPVTTIAWRMAHIIVGVFNARTASHFGGPPADYATWQFAQSADEALKQLDDAYEGWMAGARTADLSKAVGPAEGPFAEEPMATLVLHINREVIHHLAEVALLRDLYLRES
ncbi:DinB superfamily protein [Lentzea albidocapillata subsp. violacea]|uniref:DinB superfamily protein n=1 Tax=Lentzea albidocapillata subsp. violacea TaxID=128104 RepID=A0A1G9T468_9PSEU|nr:DinB family protein [Lentzea albidocapillata]SDM42523.1 DinB superfamily protein [Lentzea albidocapillata subsp. violacea]